GDHRAHRDDDDRAPALATLLVAPHLLDDRATVPVLGRLGHGAQESPAGGRLGRQFGEVYGVAGRNRTSGCEPVGSAVQPCAKAIARTWASRAPRSRSPPSSSTTSAPPASDTTAR